ncbi:response regulator transcription factor [Streptomyces sp. ISL-1]|uniref:response regulator transcription factor n=1 Tax=Streptomyces sp. ISL-1 TaxID=2817657 RepID=UPI001BEC58D3|nr:response regulator transcription factor [Streptomyces sp. ISL-1]MBT2392602.1 response regulator transcription factor [Streptomyces sp. ISL-1]
MERIFLVINSPSLRRRMTEVLAAPGWLVSGWEEGRAAKPTTPADIAVVESGALDGDPSLAPWGTRVIVLVNGRHDGFWRSSACARVAGIIDRDDPDHGYVTAVREVLSGRGWVSPELVPTLLSGRMGRSRLPEPPSAEVTLLTDREKGVAALVAEGLSNSEIAEQLTIERSTVKFHVSNVLRKLRCRDRSQLAVLWHSHTLPVRFAAA